MTTPQEKLLAAAKRMYERSLANAERSAAYGDYLGAIYARQDAERAKHQIVEARRAAKSAA